MKTGPQQPAVTPETAFGKGMHLAHAFFVPMLILPYLGTPRLTQMVLLFGFEYS